MVWARPPRRHGQEEARRALECQTARQLLASDLMFNPCDDLGPLYWDRTQPEAKIYLTGPAAAAAAAAAAEEEEEEEEEFIASGNWGGKHDSLSRGGGGAKHTYTHTRD